jgi:antitoxin component of MazEF toxin-antitoxin module
MATIAWVKVVQQGDDLALVIDRPLLDQLHITADSLLTAATEDGMLIIAPLQEEEDDEIDQAAFEATMEKIHRRYGRALQRLAE